MRLLHFSDTLTLPWNARFPISENLNIKNVSWGGCSQTHLLGMAFALSYLEPVYLPQKGVNSTELKF